MDTIVRKGGRTALPPLHSTAKIAREIAKLRSDLKKKGGGRMDMIARKGGRTTLPPSHSTAKIAMEIAKLRSDLKKKGAGEWT